MVDRGYAPDMTRTPPGLDEGFNDPVLTAALQVLAEQGLKGATTRAIAARAGVNEVTLFRRYGNKAGLLRAAVLSRASALAGSGVQDTGNLEADLIHLTRHYQAALETVGPVIRVIATEFPRHPELRGLLDGPLELFRRIGVLLTRYQQGGQLRPEPLTTLLPALIGPLVLPHLIPDLFRTLAPDLAPDAPDPFTLDAAQHVHRFLHGRVPHPEDPA